MISIEKCQKTLTDNGVKFNYETVKELREYLYFLASLESRQTIIN